MEERVTVKSRKESKEASVAMFLLENHKGVAIEKGGRKMKKEHVREKKKNKFRGREETTTPSHDDHLMILAFQKSDPQIPLIQSQSEASKETAHCISDHKLPYPFEKILKRPAYIGIDPCNKIIGHFGHATAYFKRPVLEGQFYMEFILRKGKLGSRKLAYQPSMRVGVCGYSFNYSFPLGWGESVGYASTEGSVIYDGEIIHKGQAVEEGDVVGVLINMSPPFKHPDPSLVSQNSTLSFYKNGQLIFCFRELKQTFYCFALSTFNYSQVEIVTTDAPKFDAYEGAKHYFESLTDKIPYKDLEDSNIFKI